MSLNITVTKKVLETIVHETFSNFGFLASSSLLDSLKLLGFYYATNAGISINIEDLKTPDLKKYYIETANKEIYTISQAWSEGIVSDQERFQSIIDSWNIATESLKNRIVEYYQDFDPANNLYIMAFSGARGNMSQVRQLVGMRGLMSDQEGKIIDLPIQANFREGLSSIDYIISSYGARKGIVDTALKTADSGYLTRRLIYLAQDLVIREIDCKTKTGILVLLKKKSSIKNLIGRELLNAKKNEFPFSLISNLQQNIQVENSILTSELLGSLKTLSPVVLKIRSSLTCQSNGSICQKCYGWDLAHQKSISLGETVGIIAAQSIGEPGTQLTMRTFHTGGIFTGETLKQILAPFSGKIIIPKSLKTVSYRTNHGVDVLKLQQEASIQLIDWKGTETHLFLEIGSYLYISETTFVYKGQLIAEFLNQSIISSQRKLKPIYTRISGKVIQHLILSFRRTRKGKTRRILLKQGILWIASGKIFSLPIQSDYMFLKDLKKEKAIAKLKIITPKAGIVCLTNSTFSILTKKRKITFNFTQFSQAFPNCSVKIIPLVRNYQYVDHHTILGYLYIFSNITSEIVSIEKKDDKLNSTFFISTKSDAWNLYGPLSFQTTKQGYERNYENLKLSFSFFKDEIQKETEKQSSIIETLETNSLLSNNSSGLPLGSFLNKIISPSKFQNSLLKMEYSGLKLHEDRYFHRFQHLEAICLPTSTILNYIHDDLVEKKKLLATLVNYTQQTDDIVQGLPKIEELIEARKPKIEACLAKRPGIFLTIEPMKCEPEPTYKEIVEEENSFKCLIPTSFSKKKPKTLKEEEQEKKQLLIIGESFLGNKKLLSYEKRFFKVNYFSSLFRFVESENCFKSTKTGSKLEFSGKKYKWKHELISRELLYEIYSFLRKQNNKLLNSLIFDRKQENTNYIIYKATNNISGFDYIFPLNDKISIYLTNLEAPIKKYSLPMSIKILLQPGDFIDIGEPISDGIIDSHELLNILFSYHTELDGIIEGMSKSLNKFQLILLNSIQSIYQAQGVNISSKHIEIIVRQMTSKVVIKKSGDTPFLAGELIPTFLIRDIYKAFEDNKAYKTPLFEPKLLSATNSSLNKDGFLSAAGFQETRKILTKAAIEGNSDWLRGLKESLMSGRMIPAGSAFLNYKNYLDNLYSFKNEFS
jgi:hypothetical protein